MKYIVPFSLALLTLFLGGCDANQISPSVIEVGTYNEVSVAGNIILRFRQDESNTSNQQEVHIVSAGADRLRISAQGGQLRIVGDGISLNEQVIVEIYPESLFCIRLESGQHAIFEGVIIAPELKIVTEGNSTLEMSGLQVDHIEAKLEAESQLTLSTYLESLADSADYLKSKAILVDPYSLQLENTLVRGDSVKLLLSVTGEEIWRVYGQEIFTYYFPLTTTYKTEANVQLDALESPTDNIQINLEGSSEATVWSIDQLSGKGEGESTLSYAGDPAVIDFILQGNARLINLQ